MEPVAPHEIEGPQFGPPVRISCHRIACEVTATPIASKGWRITRDGMLLGTVLKREADFAAYKDYGRTRVPDPFNKGKAAFGSLADAAEALVVVC